MHAVRKMNHNWLALDISNSAYKRYRHRFTGVVADLGCGRAPYKSDILEVAESYIGVDWPNSLHDQSHVDVFSNLNEHIDLPDKSVDSVMVMHVLEHLSEPVVFLEEVSRILKPGGFVLITVPFNWHIHEEPHDFYRYTPYCLDHLLRKVDFEEIEVTPEGGLLTTLTLKTNYAMRKGLPGALRHVGSPLWYLNQHFARWFDKRHASPRECTAVTAAGVKRDEP